jgi:arylsulfatase A-like enzyme
MVLAALGIAGCGSKDSSPQKSAASGSGGSASGAATPVKPPAAAASRGPERAVYSLVDNRLAAHRFCGDTAIVETGSMGFVKFVRFGNTVRGSKRAWELGQKDGEIKVAKFSGKTASMYVPLTAKQKSASVLRFRMHADSQQAMTVKINGGDEINMTVAGGWVTAEVKAEGKFKEGENEIVLFMASPNVSIAWVAVGEAPVSTDGANLAPSWDGSSLAINQGCGMAWYAVVPPQGLITADLKDGACSIAVNATGEDGKVVTGSLQGTGSAVDLAALAGKAARIELQASGCAVTNISKAALVVPGATPPPSARGPAPKYVVMWVMDSLRADRVRPFNAKARPEAPTFEALAADSAMFMQMYTQGNESRVSHASIWTSLYPIKHRSIEEKEYLDLKWTSVEEVAKKAGKATFGVSANGYIHTKRGFGDKWDQYANHIQQKLGLKGSDILKQGLEWVGDKKEPWFLYMGTIDTHVTWRPKSPWIEKYADAKYDGPYLKEYGDDGKAAKDKAEMSEADKNHVRALYDSNVSYQDDLLKQLIEKLKSAGIWDQTMLIVTADHGDEQWEEGKVGHGGSVRETLIHVPLVVHYPPLVKAGLMMEGAESIDIVPTIADALGVAFDSEWQGHSLIPVANGSDSLAGYPMLSVASQYENFHGGRLGDWKIRLTGSGAPKVYQLSSDPRENEDLYGNAKSAIGTRLMLDAMWQWRQWNEQWNKTKWGTAANVSSTFASDVSK